MKRTGLIAMLVLFATSFAVAQTVPYQRPPEVIEQLALAESAPKYIFNNDYSAMMMCYAHRHISIKYHPLDELILAQTRIDPVRYCRSMENGYHDITLKRLATGEEIKVSNLPEGGRIILSAWYPTGDKILMYIAEEDGIYPYSATLADGRAERISNRRINTTGRKQLIWVNDTDFISACVVEGREPFVRTHPTGPVVQQNLGKKSKVSNRTHQGLLRNEFEHKAFEYYFTSQLVLFSQSGEKEIGKPAIFRTIMASPNGAYLIIYRITKPFSETVGYGKLRAKVAIEDLNGNVVKQVRQRGHLGWLPNRPATITWVVSAKKDNPDYKASVYEQDAPFNGENRLLARTPAPIEKIYWCNDELALVVEKGEKNNRTIYSFKPGDLDSHKRLLSYDSKDIYTQPGTPIMVRNSFGRRVVWTNNTHDEVMFNCEGHKPDGQMPALVRYSLNSGKSEEVWRCQAPYYERITASVDPSAGLFITSRESFTEPVNLYLRDFNAQTEKALTNITELYPALKGVQKRILTYKRADGLEMTSTVWLPAGYDPKRDGKLPVFINAYPSGYKNAAESQKIKGSLYTHLGPGYPIYATQGYCVVRAAMPLLPIDGKKKANDTFIKQLVMNAEAVIDALDKAGYGDPNRVAITGHSYGGFMTANLLTHTKLFKAGIARSGAYNRSLTPFGFQDEGRNYWRARNVYNAMSPFNYADKLSGALLMIHGSKDQNMGTHTIQSQRYFQALRGHKKYVRYVELPAEGHGYKYKESVLHVYYETYRWLEKYVKNPQPLDEKRDK